MVHDNRSRCPVCARPIRERLDQDSRYNCPECGNKFVIKWNKQQRDYRFVDIADLGRGEPLGLPRGSVRAIVTILISLTIWIQFITDRTVPHYMLNLAIVMVGYYFAFRVLTAPLKGVPAVVEKGTKEPLYMPKGFVRWIILIGFFISGFFLLFRGDIWYSEMFEFYVILVGLTIGYLFRKFIVEKMKVETPMWMKNTKSVAVLSVSLFILVIFTFFHPEVVPEFTIRGAIAVIGFYFGSRN